MNLLRAALAAVGLTLTSDVVRHASFEAQILALAHTPDEQDDAMRSAVVCAQLGIRAEELPQLLADGLRVQQYRGLGSADDSVYKAVQANDIADTVITVSEKIRPGEWVDLHLPYGIADALWEKGYRREAARDAHDGAVAAAALRQFADAVRMPGTVLRRADGSEVTVGYLLRERAAELEAGQVAVTNHTNGSEA